MSNDMVQVVWNAADIVALAGVIAWPIAAVTLVLLLRSKISGIFAGFFNNNAVTEVTAGNFSAKFSQSKQGANKPEDSQESMLVKVNVSEDASAVITRQSQDETKLSNNILKSLTSHRKTLGLTDKKAVEILEKELSLTQAKIYFLDLNRVIYRSQYNLFKMLQKQSGSMSESDVSAYYESVKLNSPLVFKSVELIQYLAYPMRVGLVEKVDGEYKLTNYGESYIHFMDKNSNLIPELGQN